MQATKDVSQQRKRQLDTERESGGDWHLKWLLFHYKRKSECDYDIACIYTYISQGYLADCHRLNGDWAFYLTAWSGRGEWETVPASASSLPSTVSSSFTCASCDVEIDVECWAPKEDATF